MSARKDLVDAIWHAVETDDVEQLLEYMHQYVECWPNASPARTLYRGHEGVRQMVVDFNQVMGQFRIETSGCDDSKDVVLWWGHVIREGARGDLQSLPLVMSFEFRDGLVVSINTLNSDAR